MASGVTGDNSSLLKNLVGDRNNGNGGAGIILQGAGNLVQENKVYANGADGINVTGGTAATAQRHQAEHRRRQVAGQRRQRHPRPGRHRERRTQRAGDRQEHGQGERSEWHSHRRRRHGPRAEGQRSGDKSPELNNGGCEFLVAAGNLNATGNKANGVTIAGADGSAFPTTCIGTP